MPGLVEVIRRQRDELLAPIREKLALLDEIEALAGRLDAAMPPPSDSRGRMSTTAPRAAQRRQARAERREARPRQPKLTEQEAAPSIRDAIADEPLTIDALIKGVLGRSRNTHTTNVVRRVLEQLGAVQEHGRWSLPRDAPGDREPASELNGEERSVAAIAVRPVEASALDAAGLDPDDPERDAIAPEASRNGNHAVEEEIDRAYLERALLREMRKAPISSHHAAAKIDAPLLEVELACERMERTGQISRTTEGTFCA